MSFSPGMLAVMPELHPNCFQPSEPSSVPSPKPPIRASELPVRSFAWSAVPMAGLLFRATPRHMHCASGRRRLLCTPLGVHHSIYNGEMARLLGLSSAGDVSVLGRPASVMRARRTACTYPSAANPHTACCRLRIYMEGNARIYVNGQLPGPPSVHSPPLLI